MNSRLVHLNVPRFRVLPFLLLLAACGGGGDTAEPGGFDSSIDSGINAQVRCVVTDVDSSDVVDIEQLDNGEGLVTVAAKAYFYYNETITVTNYSEESRNVYLEYRLVDDTGKVIDTSNFLEVVGAGETVTMEDRKIVQTPSEVVLRGDSNAGETVMNCQLTEAKLSG